MKYPSILVLSIALLVGTASGAVWYVHPDSSMNCIQDCLDSCATGDTILVGAGTYHESIIWPAAQSIVLISEYGADTTIIDGDSTSTVIFLAGTVDSTTIIDGFTIQNGNDLNSGGIMCDNAAPTIRNNNIRNNFGIYGAGITCIWSSGNPIIEGNTIAHNHADSTGGGISIAYGAAPRILANIIDSNTAYRGGGIYSRDNAPIIEGNAITGNYAAWFGGGIYLLQSQAIITNNTITTNRTLIYEQGAGIYIGTNSAPTIKHCVISDNFREGIVGYLSFGTIDSCTIVGNEFDGMTFSGGASPTIHHCNIYGHLSYGLRNINTTTTIDAENNWWGHTTGPYHASTNPGGQGDAVTNFVDFDPWLSDSVHGIGIEELVVEKPLAFNLQVNPNPFTDRTQIRFTIHDSRSTIENTALSIYDASGRLVKSFNHESCIMDHGSAISWDGTDQLNRRLPSGVYFVNLSTEKQSETRKVLLVR
jgi:hypothetical protein